MARISANIRTEDQTNGQTNDYIDKLYSNNTDDSKDLTASSLGLYYYTPIRAIPSKDSYISEAVMIMNEINNNIAKSNLASRREVKERAKKKLDNLESRQRFTPIDHADPIQSDLYEQVRYLRTMIDFL
ncbi:MAG: hypothetical protein WC838_07840 [Candidatus Margulisiibacteriota bacterium]|jgi:hypothetical protein